MLYIRRIPAIFTLLLSTHCYAIDSNKNLIIEDNLKRRADAILTLMSFTVLPDITTSKLSLQKDKSSSDDPELLQSTLGGGFTISKDIPVYLEGTLGYSRYDPKFIYTNGVETRKIPGKWNSLSAK